MACGKVEANVAANVENNEYDGREPNVCQSHPELLRGHIQPTVHHPDVFDMFRDGKGW